MSIRVYILAMLKCVFLGFWAIFHQSCAHSLAGLGDRKTALLTLFMLSIVDNHFFFYVVDIG